MQHYLKILEKSTLFRNSCVFCTFSVCNAILESDIKSLQDDGL